MSTKEKTTKYMNIYNSIRDRIILKTYADGSRLPTESSLMEEFQVGRNTVRTALKKLQEDGYIEIRKGSGSIVHYDGALYHSSQAMSDWSSAVITLEMNDDFKDYKISPAITDIVAGPSDVMDAFDLGYGTEVFRIQSIWSVRETPYLYMIQYVNPRILPDFDTQSKELAPFDDLLKKYNLSSTSIVQYISSCNADFVEANLLNVNVRDALLVTKRISECENGVYEYTYMYSTSHFNAYKIIIK